ncbi:MAG: DoxX family protein [Methyloligellaceae bacterium]
MIKIFFRIFLAVFMITAGVLHFISTDGFAQIVPAWLPWPRELVLISGVFEIAGGLGLLLPLTRKWAGYGLILLYIAVLPANINMAIYRIQPLDFEIPDSVLWARIPFQLVFIVWAWWVSREV